MISPITKLIGVVITTIPTKTGFSHLGRNSPNPATVDPTSPAIAVHNPEFVSHHMAATATTSRVQPNCFSWRSVGFVFDESSAMFLFGVVGDKTEVLATAAT